MKHLLATTLFGLENVLAEELESLGAGEVVKHNRAVSFRGDKSMLYRANYHLRTALRVLESLNSFPARSEDEVYEGIRNMEWERYLEVRQLIAVDTVLAGKRYRHSGFISRRVKDGIVDRFRERRGSRPSVDLQDPDVRIHIHLSDSRCSVSLDSSGESLHKRGYRVQAYLAPLSEVLAAGMILLSGWTPDEPFLNPMCGSGTLCIEAGMISGGIPGGYFRKEFGFQRWKDYDPGLFESVRREKYLEARDDCRILACDRAAAAIEATRRNLESAGLPGRVEVQRTEFESWDTGLHEGVIIMNPPYGERLNDEGLTELYRNIGDTLKKNYSGCRAWVLSGNPDALKNLGLRTSRKASLYNGPILCKYHCYDLYEGSRKIVNKTQDV